jgi:hypothetical protein
MITKPKLSSLVASQVPEFVRSDYQSFVAFLEAYYEYLDSTQQNLEDLRDLDKTLGSFIRYFKDEVANKMPYTAMDERFLMEHIKEHYGAKGSESSYKLLFRILFGKEVSIDYPAKQMLRASDGKWNQDVSIFCKILTGNPNDPIGKMVDVVTPTKIIRVLVDRRQYVEIEVDRAVKVMDGVYEYFIDRRFFGNIAVGDRIRYRDDVNGIYFTAEILSTTSTLEVQKPGSGFKVGGLYNIKNFDGYGSIMKVVRVDSNGGILQAQFIKYGIGYTTDFTTTLSASSGQDVAGTAGTTIQRIDQPVGNGNFLVNLSITDRMDGFAESGTINMTDYWTTYADGSYVGQVMREFGISNIDATAVLTDPAIIKCSLGPLAKYPGYYVNNDGFLDDAIYIQDSRYYQSYSYVVKIDEALDSYKTAVKNLIHPAGMAIFGEYDIRNEFDISEQLECLIKILNINTKDSVTTQEIGLALDLTRTMPYFNITKYFDDQSLNADGNVEGQYVTMQEIGIALDNTRTMPYLDITKPINNTTLNYDGVAEVHQISLSDGGDVTNSTRTMPYLDVTKVFDTNHVIADGVTTDSESVFTLDETGSGSTRTMPYFNQSKTLGYVDGVNTHLNFDGVFDTDSVSLVENAIGYGYGGLVRTGLDTWSMNKSISAGHLLFDNVTADPESVIPLDTDASSATDLNRTTPAISLTTTFGVLLNDGVTPDTNIATASDSGGTMDLNPYAEAGWFLNDGGLFVGNPITFSG